jgi:tripartite-type tricarboxylate transporter receptor subunit TctC
MEEDANEMKLPRRQFLHLAAGAAAMPVISHIARAQTYPTRAARIVVPFAAGGSTDISARLIGQWLSERLGQQFVIENRPGAGSNVGTELVVNAPPDGYTLLLVGASSAINATLYEKLNFNFLRDIKPVSGIMSIPFIMVLNPSFPAKTVSEFIAYARANPGKVNLASGGNGTAGHLSGELFKLLAGLNMVHVPYRGEAPALTDMIAGHVQAMFGTMPASIEHVRAGKLRALAVTSAGRSELLPDLPTGSIRRSMRASLILKLRRGLPTWAARCLRVRPPTSGSSWPMRPRSGARWSSSPAPNRTDPG